MNGYILEQVERGFTSYLASSSLSSSVPHFYQGNSSTETKESPAVIVQAASMEEDFYGSGIWHVDTRVFFIYPYETTGSADTRNAIEETLSSTLFTGSLGDSIATGSGKLAIYDIFSRGTNISIQDNHWVSEYAFEVIATSAG